jgi:hypothetical protein
VERVITVWDGNRTWNVPHGPVVYFVGTDAHISHLVKIGRTIDLQRRLDILRGSCPIPLRIVAVTRNYGRTEESLHATFADVRAHGEWFDLGADPVSTIAARVHDLDQYAAIQALPPLED